MISVRPARHSREDLDASHAYRLTLREVLAFYHVAGANDYLLQVAVADSNHLRDFALDAFAAGREVAHIGTNLIFTFRGNSELAI